MHFNAAGGKYLNMFRLDTQPSRLINRMSVDLLDSQLINQLSGCPTQWASCTTGLVSGCVTLSCSSREECILPISCEFRVSLSRLHSKLQERDKRNMWLRYQAAVGCLTGCPNAQPQEVHKMFCLGTQSIQPRIYTPS